MLWCSLQIFVQWQMLQQFVGSKWGEHCGWTSWNSNGVATIEAMVAHVVFFSFCGANVSLSDLRANYRNSLLYACCCANANGFRHEITLYIKFVSMNWQILAWYGSTACPIRLQSLYVDLFQTMFPRKLVYVFGFVWFVSHLHIGSVYGTFPSPSFLRQSNVGWLESCAAFPQVDNMILSIQYAVVWCSSCFREFPSQ